MCKIFKMCLIILGQYVLKGLGQFWNVDKSDLITAKFPISTSVNFRIFS